MTTHRVPFALASVLVLLCCAVPLLLAGTTQDTPVPEALRHHLNGTVPVMSSYPHDVRTVVEEYSKEHTQFVDRLGRYRVMRRRGNKLWALRNLAVAHRRQQRILAGASLRKFKREIIKHRRAAIATKLAKARVRRLTRRIKRVRAEIKKRLAKGKNAKTMLAEIKATTPKRKETLRLLQAASKQYAALRRTYRINCQRSTGKKLGTMLRKYRFDLRGKLRKLTRALRKRFRRENAKRRGRRSARRRARQARRQSRRKRRRSSSSNGNKGVTAASIRLLGETTAAGGITATANVTTGSNGVYAPPPSATSSQILLQQVPANDFWKRQSEAAKRQAAERKAEAERKRRDALKTPQQRAEEHARRVKERAIAAEARRANGGADGNGNKAATREALRRTPEYRANCGTEARAAVERSAANVTAYASERVAQRRTLLNMYTRLRTLEYWLRDRRARIKRAVKRRTRINNGKHLKGSWSPAAMLHRRKVAFERKRRAFRVLHAASVRAREASAKFREVWSAVKELRRITVEARERAAAAHAKMIEAVDKFEHAEVLDTKLPKTFSGDLASDGAGKERTYGFVTAEGKDAPARSRLRLSSVAAGSWEGIYGIASEGKMKGKAVLWDVEDAKWRELPGGGASNRGVAIGCGGGGHAASPWRISASGIPMRLQGRGTWSPVGGSRVGPLRSLSIGTGRHAWAATARGGSLLRFRPNQDLWTPFEGPIAPVQNVSGKLTYDRRLNATRQVAVGCDGEVWIVTESHDLYHLVDRREMVWKRKGRSVSSVSVGSSHELFVTGLDGGLFEYRAPTSADTSKDHHWFKWPRDNVRQVAAAADGTVLALLNDGSLVKHVRHEHGLSASERAHLESVRGGRWEKMAHSSAVSHVSMGPDGLIWGISTAPFMLLKSSAIHRPFTSVPDAPMKRVTQACDRSMWGINAAGTPVEWSTASDSFETRGKATFKASEISACGDGVVYAVSQDGKLTHWDAESARFAEVRTFGSDATSLKSKTGGPPSKLLRVACNCAGYVFVVGADNSLWAQTRGPNLGFTWYGKGVKEIAAGSELYLTDKDDNLYKFSALPRVGGYGPNVHWRSLHKRLRTVAVSPDDHLAGIDTHGACVAFTPTRTGLTTPSWTRVPGSVTHISLVDGNTAYALSGTGKDAGRLSKFDKTERAWLPVRTVDNARLTMISAGCDGSLFGILRTSGRDSRGDMPELKSSSPRKGGKNKDGKKETDKSKGKAKPKAKAKPAQKKPVPEKKNSNNNNNNKGNKAMLDLLLQEEAEEGDDDDDDDSDVLAERVFDFSSDEFRGDAADTGAEVDHPATMNGLVVRLDGNDPEDDPTSAPSREWTRLPNSEGIVAVAAGSATDVWGLDVEGRAHMFSASRGEWLELVGDARPPALSQISHGCGDGQVWGVAKGSGDVYEYSGSVGAWQRRASGIAKEVRVGERAYVLSKRSHRLYRFDPERKGGHWVKLSDKPLFSLSAGAHGVVWAVDRFDRIYAVSMGDPRDVGAPTSDGLPAADIPEHLLDDGDDSQNLDAPKPIDEAVHEVAQQAVAKGNADPVVLEIARSRIE